MDSDDWLAAVVSSPSVSQREHQTRQAHYVCKVSLFITLVTALGACALSVLSRSSALLSLGLEAWVDVISTCIVLWRFGGSGAIVPSPAELDRREKRASIGR